MRGGGGGTYGGVGAGGEVFCSLQFLASIDHGGHHHPMATMIPYSQRGSIQQSANARQQVSIVKLENISLLMFIS